MEIQSGLYYQKEVSGNGNLHLASMFLEDGIKQKAAYKADQIGKYWVRDTKGKGCYVNCKKNIKTTVLEW